ncbi:SIT4 phosphatase-associated protein-domain-containing protein [Multifurca ochricompacta]|uniref:SIT4 phosphatase-associated protein-domain-containing protein n=1 Tax=Multifurca ochricompacta TaxID=376703 RepID=A0AAD4QPA1_9AGAM|nr:SIT4 phosphatase-associated protein-domain-containing protein [Multifurca ochricompacta]
MFWRFGFHNGSSIDSLLDKDDVSLEAILDEDDLLQECKAQNTRLIDYFQRLDVLQRLLGYVTGQIEGEDRGRFKYPYVATEVLCSEIWSIVETCLNNTDQLLGPFWETVLDRTPEDMKTRMTMASQFAKINAVFLSKKPAEMLQFIRAQRDIIERILQHIEMPSFSDLLIRIIQLDEQPAGAGVLEWLSEQRLMTRLVRRLSPVHSSNMHVVVAELIKGIISMSAPSPAAGLSEGLQTGLASNRFARELASRENMQILVDYILNDFKDITPVPTSSEDDELCDPISPTLPNYDSATSSIINSICMVIELIRQNNSDYFEPYLFHTLRNRLIHVQQQLSTRDPDEGRVALEGAMKEMVDRIGVVHLGPLLVLFCDRLHELKPYVQKPRSSDGPVSTTVGIIAPLTFERYRICELYAELLHCSNMSLLNRSADYDYLYDSEGRLQGGLSALEELAQVISMGSGDEDSREAMDEGVDEIEPALEFPVHGAPQDSSSLLDSDEDMSDDEGPGSFEDDPMEDVAVSGESKSTDGGPKPKSGFFSPSHTRFPADTLHGSASPGTSPLLDPASPGGSRPPRRKGSNQSIGSEGSTIGRRSAGSRRSSKRLALTDASQSGLFVPVGERLKHRLLEDNVLTSILDLFFEYPWNNFLHSVVYDLIHQILTGRVDGGANRLLAIALFRDARLMERILEGQKLNDVESAKPKGVRLGYMGHLTLISEDVITTLDHFPLDLRQVIEEYAPQPAWDDYVRGRYKETKKKDSSPLGGGKPAMVASISRPVTQWKVDEEDSSAPVPPSAIKLDLQETKGEFRRATGSRPALGNTADFGVASAADDDDDDFTTATHPTYLAHEMQRRDEFDGSSSSSDASDEEDGGWLAQSRFDMQFERPAPAERQAPARGRRPLSEAGMDSAFPPAPADSPFNDPFSTEDDDDDGFGPFSDSAAASRSDPFNLSSSFSEDIQEVSFDSFGDFGDFQSAGDGETTPTAGSWTFASGSSHSSPSDTGDGSGDEKEADARTTGERKPDQ